MGQVARFKFPCSLSCTYSALDAPIEGSVLKSSTESTAKSMTTCWSSIVVFRHYSSSVNIRKWLVAIPPNNDYQLPVKYPIYHNSQRQL